MLRLTRRRGDFLCGPHGFEETALRWLLLAPFLKKNVSGFEKILYLVRGSCLELPLKISEAQLSWHL
jgi:hypothetical protein